MLFVLSLHLLRTITGCLSTEEKPASHLLCKALHCLHSNCSCNYHCWHPENSDFSIYTSCLALVKFNKWSQQLYYHLIDSSPGSSRQNMQWIKILEGRKGATHYTSPNRFIIFLLLLFILCGVRKKCIAFLVCLVFACFCYKKSPSGIL